MDFRLLNREVIALESLMYCAHNAYRNAGDINGIGVVQERRVPLTWAFHPGASWTIRMSVRKCDLRRVTFGQTAASKFDQKLVAAGLLFNQPLDRFFDLAVV